jgi:GPH family glycoside/pentoside/hexuronide:cation symporter
MYYFTYGAQLEGWVITVIMMIFSFGGLPFTPIVVKIAEKTDKKRAMLFCLIGPAIAIAAFWFFESTSPLSLCILALIMCLPSTGYWQLMPAIIYDICELDELENGKRREGAIVSLLSLAEALSSAISMQLLGLVLDLSGFVGEAATQTPQALAAVKAVFMLTPAAMFIITAILMWRYPIGKKEFEEIQNKLNKQ